jgi:apolipoprotein D and lipocalin family protein
MRTAVPLLALGIFLPLAAISPAPARAEVPEAVALEHADINRFMGRWYEIARLPNNQERACARDVVSTYERRTESAIRVVNVCRNAEGELERSQGVARIRDGLSQAKLEFRFAPLALAWLPFLWDDWWILEVAPEYSYMMAGDPSHQRLWIYARTRELDDTTYRTLVAHAAAQGYDTTRLVRTPQSTP